MADTQCLTFLSLLGCSVQCPFALPTIELHLSLAGKPCDVIVAIIIAVASLFHSDGLLQGREAAGASFLAGKHCDVIVAIIIAVASLFHSDGLLQGREAAGEPDQPLP